MARAAGIVRAELADRQSKMSDIFDGFKGDDFSQMDPELFKKAEGLNEELGALEVELTEAVKTEDSARKMRDNLRAKQMPAAGGDGSKTDRNGTIITPENQRKSIGQLF